MCCTNAEEMQGNPPSLRNAHLETHSRRNLKQRSAIFRKLLEKQQKRRFFGIFFHFSLKEILENLKGLYQTSFKTRTFFHRKNANSINYLKECRSSLYQNTSFDTFGRNTKMVHYLLKNWSLKFIEKSIFRPLHFKVDLYHNLKEFTR